MEAVVQFAQTSGIYAFMNSPWGWPIAESLHFIGLSFLIGTVGVFDLRLLGLAPAIPIPSLHKIVPWGVAGYALNVATGFCFFVTAPDQYFYNPAFRTKMGFMLLAGLNMLLFYKTTAAELIGSENKRPLANPAKIFAAVSLGCWIAVIICGRLITYYRPPYHWCLWC